MLIENKLTSIKLNARPDPRGAAYQLSWPYVEAVVVTTVKASNHTAWVVEI